MPLEDTEIGDEPLEYRPTTTSFPQISDEMVASIALGLEDDLVVASRHGLSVEKYREIEAQPWFQLQVAAKRSEFERNGVTFKAKAAWMAGELLERVYLMAADNNASFSQAHEALKTLIKAGGLEPKEEKSQATGPSFQISIDLGDRSVSLGSSAPTPMVIDVPLKELPGE